ncbi:type II secretion system protein N [Sinimarinibacterium sp. CAU 1509]|uniref:type II secretion system protein N n=1 Tax=Sinimarinibacterium sp. CAU 1509 TaxID=2562283 RepID=UPI0010AD3B2E|nr:type II secretion system protein N [Sinimarinibacterium sp. CAU 1509]TJY55781.1 type II secretion system protein N [Sinimarinibacterium sp. CAU 1509]
MKMRSFLIIGLTTFVLALLVKTPAATVYGWFGHAISGSQLRLFGIGGSLLSGHADAVVVRGIPALSRVEWRLQPLSLLLARAQFHLHAAGAPILLDGKAAVGLGPERLDDLKASSDLRSLAAIAGQPFVPMQGQIALDLAHLRLRDNWPVSAEGRATVSSLSWSLGPQPIPLGNYQADFSNEGDDLLALISTLSGPLEVNGDARLKGDRSYELHLQLRPKPDAPPMIANLLRSTGAPDAQGYFHLRQSGKAAP